MQNKPQSKHLVINLGTYTGNLISISFQPFTKTITDKYSIKVSDKPLRTLYHSSPYLFVSGTDEIIHIYNLTSSSSYGDLLTYSGSINDIKVYNNWLIAAGDEPQLPLWRMSDFNNIINMKGHKKGINSIDIHPKGGFLVSSGRDNAVIIFDLMTGRKIEKFEFDSICNKVSLFKKGKYLLTVFDFKVKLINLMMNTTNKLDAIIQEITTPKKIIHAYIYKNKTLLLFLNDASIRKYTLTFNTDNNKTYIPLNDPSKDYIELHLERPSKQNENDLDITPRYISIATDDTKIKTCSIVYSNNSIYIYDLLRIVKQSKSNEVPLKKYFNINLLINNITCIDSEIHSR